ncbi:uncharacterized protein [Amphiura filiformis]|uniref:uncharacterized protein isoform X2 n=1 Tax=Amphiura filiformis TaxID=82378 RepID=UPI003B22472F
MMVNLVVVVVSIFIMFFNSASSETKDCIALCNECVEVSETLTHMRCTKHCEKLKQNEDGIISCSKITAPNKGNPSLEVEINELHARISELVKNGEYSAMVEEVYTNDCFGVANGQAPFIGKEEMAQVWFNWLTSNGINRPLYTSTAFGESKGYVWDDGIVNAYKDDVFVASVRYMKVYKRVHRTLLIFVDIIY